MVRLVSRRYWVRIPAGSRIFFCGFISHSLNKSTIIHECLLNYDIGISFYPAAVLRGIPYQNNSIVILENIGEGDDVLFCITFQTTCCRPPYTGEMGPTLGNWFFPNGTGVPGSSNQSDFYRTRGQMVVGLHRVRGGEEGIYRCEIPDAMNVTQTIYIGVYSASTGE